MTRKEKLIQRLENLHQYGVKGILDTEIVADFILLDRKRTIKRTEKRLMSYIDDSLNFPKS